MTASGFLRVFWWLLSCFLWGGSQRKASDHCRDSIPFFRPTAISCENRTHHTQCTHTHTHTWTPQKTVLFPGVHVLSGEDPKRNSMTQFVLRCFRAVFGCFRVMFSAAPRAASSFLGRPGGGKIKYKYRAGSRYVYYIYVYNIHSYSITIPDCKGALRLLYSLFGGLTTHHLLPLLRFASSGAV